ncbi:site specific recombinase, authentic frame shift [Streptococcus mitis B6]|uniref:Site specific recombinase, authentic frame shift n=1 Tax=Streptococcus mitis (strain B6) TaxID=365659 RepID=D3HAQ7_STRM6|nr:site specific recombinase, authentic frame shift [Streptococcus mitis B6]
MIDLVRIFDSLSNPIRMDILLIISNKNTSSCLLSSFYRQ